MDGLTATGICVGILAAIWGSVSSQFGLVTAAGFIAYASFYAAGGKLGGLKDAMCANFAGLIWGIIAMYGGNWLGGIIGSAFWGSAILTLICSTLIVWEAKIPLLKFIPGAFFGMTIFFTTGGNILGTAISLFIGAFLGLGSELGGKYLSKATTKGKESTETAQNPAENT